MKDNEVKYPIYGGITTKRGVYYRYAIRSNHTVDVWKEVRTNTAPKKYKEKSIMVDPTKEILRRLSEKYGFEVKA